MRSLSILALLLLTVSGPLGAAVFTVNNTGDQGDANTSDNLCATAGAVCTLRAAIQQANVTAGTDTIAFNISGAGPHVINPASALPNITQAVTIDGTTEPSYVQGSPAVVLKGTGTAPGTNGMVFAAGSGGSTLRGLVVQSFPAIGVAILSDGCVLERTYIGTNAGTSPAGNGGAGVLVLGNSNMLGVANDGAKRILVSANGGDGIVISGSSNTLQFSHVGTNLAGTAALANAGSGVVISGSSNTLIQNLVSGNAQDGIRITAGMGNVVRTNHLIGLNVFGTGAMPNGGSGVSIQGGTGNTIGPFNIVSGNTGNGVTISGLPATGNVVRSNFIGLTLAGTTALPNGQAGVFLSTTAGNTVGGTAVGSGNVISGNSGIGVRVVGGNGNFIQSNVIGVKPGGTEAVANGSHGISIDGSANTTVGGVAGGGGNLVSGNGGSGIVVTGAASTGLKITGNTVGPVVAGTAPLPNAVDGIMLTNVSSAIIGGGTFVGDDNVIAGNTRHGIYISGGSANQIKINEIGVDGNGIVGVGNGGHGIFLENSSGNTIDTSLISANHQDGVRISGGNGNTLITSIIGLNVAGTGTLGNLGNGVSLVNSPNNVIGQPIPGKGNSISGNLQSGVFISGAASTGNSIRNTLIGPDISDSSVLGNGGWGVLISGGSNNAVGGTLIGDSNRIRGNGLGGVGVLSGAGNAIRRNQISSNLGLAIDLDANGGLFDGITANDAGDGDLGANDLLNRPIITSATSGTLSSTPNTFFDIEIYGSPRCDPSGAGEGATLLTSLSTSTNGSGQASFSFGSVPPGTAITATAIDPNDNTSEFSACFPVLSGAPIEFDGDPASELFIHNSGAWVQFDFATGGLVPGGSVWTGTAPGCRPIMMDFDGDGRDDFTQLCGGAWHFYNDNGSYVKGIWVGNIPGNLPVPADYDGDGKDEVVLYNGGAWVFYDFATGTYQPAKSRFTGVAGSGQIPAPLDYDGDGKAEFSVFVGGAWHFFNELGQYVKGIWIGTGTTFPVPGDYDGDGHDDVVAFRGGVWSFYDFSTGAYVPGKSVFTGTPAHISGGTSTPEPLDVNGDGIMDRSIFAGGPWHFYNANGTYAKGVWTGAGTQQPVSARPQQ